MDTAGGHNSPFFFSEISSNGIKLGNVNSTPPAVLMKERAVETPEATLSPS